jgi:hypothetical protein
VALSNYQCSYGGLTWGPGTDIQLAGLAGFRGRPGERSGDVPKGRYNGSFAGLNFLDERIFVATLMVFAPRVLTIAQVVNNIAAAFQPVSDPTLLGTFQFQDPMWATPRQVLCRPTALDLPVDQDYNVGKITIPVQFTAPDPLVYDSVLSTAGPVGLPSPTAGLTFNAAANFVFGASTGGSLSVTNSGLYTTAPVFTITGPMTNPRLQHPSGLFFAVNLTLGAGDTLVIDTGAKTVVLNGTAPRGNTVVTGSSWFGFVPGTQSIGVGSSDSAAVAGTFSATWRSAWGTN